MCSAGQAALVPEPIPGTRAAAEKSLMARPQHSPRGRGGAAVAPTPTPPASPEQAGAPHALALPASSKQAGVKLHLRRPLRVSLAVACQQAAEARAEQEAEHGADVLPDLALRVAVVDGAAGAGALHQAEAIQYAQGGGREDHGEEAVEQYRCDAVRLALAVPAARASGRHFFIRRVGSSLLGAGGDVPGGVEVTLAWCGHFACG
mmetsp:Transcript_1987/g.5804  ORF Transcript_1987/g.5804 Transcript_1987/m.5804 type:complete len:205 (-) Transcript_1987:161-775(-)